MNSVLTIAGSDCSGGAGIQADLKTMLMHGVYGMSVITALTAQNTCGVSGVYPVPPEFVARQLTAVFSDIFPQAVKIGMLTAEGVISVVADALMEYGAKNIVLDTVMLSTSGTRLMSQEALAAAKKKLYPLATLLTPNIPEAEVLSGCRISGRDDMCLAAQKIGQTYGCAVLCKGGHRADAADDLLYVDDQFVWYAGRRIDSKNTHGTGCTLSSAIACNLAQGRGLRASVERAKQYLTGAIADGMDLGRGNGPLNHGYLMKKKESL